MGTSVIDNPALSDMKEILATHVELTPEEAIILEKKLPSIVAVLRPEIRKDIEADYATKFSQEVDKLREENRVAITSELEKYKANLEPLSKQDITDLLNQEYTDFSFKLKETQPDGSVRERGFVIRELPQAVEDRFLKHLKEKLIPILQNLVTIDWNLDGSLADKIKNTIDALPGLLEVAAHCTMISLDPFSKENINESWVKNNISTYRMSVVILAQVEANRYRDFFSNGFRLSKNMRKSR